MTVSPSAAANSLIGLLENSIRHHSGSLAVVDAEDSVDYAELDSRSARVAASLVSNGVRRGDRVAVRMDRDHRLIITLLGILRAGAVYVAIDPSIPEARAESMVRISSPVALVANQGDAGGLGIRCLSYTVLVEPKPAVPRARTLELIASDGACVLFTSGSSGNPKPILLDHGNLAHFANNPRLPRIEAQDRVGQVSSASFDAFHFEVWGALASGACVVPLPSVVELVAEGFRSRVARDEISVLLVPTMAFNHVIAADPEAFAEVRILCTGGDVLNPMSCRTLLQSSFHGEFYNLYGPTEATTACTVYLVGSPPDGEVPIGEPLAGTSVRILDGSLNELAPQKQGEICIGGPGVAQGYWASPALTAERFRPDPNGPPGSRLYRTGDSGYIRGDGMLGFAGRSDRQVKIRGYRVELAEVEDVLLGIEDVVDAAVTTSGVGDSRSIFAVVVARAGATASRIASHVAFALPIYMVPSTIHIVETIPATPHGKRDWAEITALHERRGDAARLPITVTERILADLWRSVLRVDSVDRNDDFFALGGNSMLAFRIQVALRRDHNRTVDLRDLLCRPVLADAAQWIDRGEL